ncbi:hypothetical protein [Afifella pfennigii]|uniref:hypothetical protein n=1 Tax=Afifella pfennigii TaxID=209897 RepID=UPI00047A577F|nr:hypothetical protein [Afifella pfennigii]
MTFPCTRELGYDRLNAFITCGSTVGIPNWGRSGALSGLELVPSPFASLATALPELAGAHRETLFSTRCLTQKAALHRRKAAI